MASGDEHLRLRIRTCDGCHPAWTERIAVLARARLGRTLPDLVVLRSALALLVFLGQQMGSRPLQAVQEHETFGRRRLRHVIVQ